MTPVKPIALDYGGHAVTFALAQLPGAGQQSPTTMSGVTAASRDGLPVPLARSCAERRPGAEAVTGE
jgi:hypothetical protein